MQMVVRHTIIAIILAVAVCAGAASPALGQNARPEERYDRLISQDQQVARVAWRLMLANAELCPVTRLSAGWALHGASQYSEALRPFSVQDGLEGDLPGVLSAPPGSPAAEAGLAPGDLILSVADQPLAPGPPRRSPNYAGIEANIRRLDETLAQGRTTLQVRRDGRVRTVELTPRLACGYEVQLDPSADFGARADGRRLFVTTATADRLRGDDELAFVLGHELAHHVLGHRIWHDSGGGGRTIRRPGAEAQRPEGFEREADRVGLILQARAGYDYTVAPALWRRLGRSNWLYRLPGLDHASSDVRARRLDSVVDDLRERQAEGRPLTP